MLGPQRTVLKLAVGIGENALVHALPKEAQAIKRTSQNLLSPQLQSRSMRFFSFIPGRSDCKKKEEKKNNCPKKCEPPPSMEDQCCPHPPKKCASVCRSCPPEQRPICPPVPQRPPQPEHCQFTFDVKHKPGHCPGPCGKRGCPPNSNG